MANKPARATVTVEEFADMVGISRFSAYRELRDGNVPHLRIGKRIVIPKAALNRWLENCGAKGDVEKAVRTGAGVRA
jgi:excisionase family DNA binding protein